MSNLIPRVTLLLQSAHSGNLTCTCTEISHVYNCHCTLEQLITMKLLDSATDQTEWEGVHLPVWFMHHHMVHS